jgi:hypothetical protein
MMEVLTKKFWQDVKRTFDEARAEPPPKAGEPPALAEDNVEAASGDEVPASKEGSSL